MKYLEKKSIVPMEKATGSISDTLNIEDKITNTYSARIIDELTGIETITNDKGRAVKFPDGTLINFIDKKVYDFAITSAYGSFFVSGAYLLDFPVSFVENKISAVCGALAWGSSASWGTIFSVGLHSCSVRGYDISSRATGTETRIQVTAFGRWK